MDLLKKVFSKLIKPGCLYGPAQFFIASKSSPLHLHKKLLLQAGPNISTWQHFLVCACGVLFWYAFLFWWQLCKLYWCKTPKSRSFRRSKPVLNELLDILYLGLWLGVEPYQYFRFKLFLHDRRRWLYWVFEQEQALWLQVHSVQRHKEPKYCDAEKLLSDKYRFEKHLAQHNISSAQTLKYIHRNQDIPITELFLRRDLFLKPNSSSSMRGCLCLRYKKSQNSYELSGRNFDYSSVKLEDEEQIISLLNACFAKSDYLIQEVLENSQQLESLLGLSELVTIRIISFYSSKGCSTEESTDKEVGLAYQTLECPILKPNAEPNLNQWILYPVEQHTGEILYPHYLIKEPSQNDPQPIEMRKVGCLIPEWQRCIDLVKRAHLTVPNLKTIAWDLCITEPGPTIIEANSGWGLAAPQISSGVALLESKLIQAYK